MEIRHYERQALKSHHKGRFSTSSYWEACATSLICYAENNKDFGKIFKETITRILSTKNITTSQPDTFGMFGLHILTPQDSYTAFRKAEWIIRQIAESSVPGAEASLSLLVSWSNAYEETSPRNIIIGFGPGLIPGITLGRFTRRVSMAVILRDRYVAKEQFELSRKISSACLEVLSEALEVSGGNTRNLEPDVSDWFFGDRDMAFYSADESRLADIEKELNVLGVAHAGVREGEEIVLLALSPEVNITYCQSSWDIEPLVL